MVAHGLSRRAVLEMAAASGLARGASRTRLLVVTGGHEFDASFWAIFKDHPESPPSWMRLRRAPRHRHR
jgi:hypothetical protein